MKMSPEGQILQETMVRSLREALDVYLQGAPNPDKAREEFHVSLIAVMVNFLHDNIAPGHILDAARQTGDKIVEVLTQALAKPTGRLN